MAGRSWPDLRRSSQTTATSSSWPSTLRKPSRSCLPRTPKTTLTIRVSVLRDCLSAISGPGLCVYVKRIIHNFAKEVSSPNAVDRTDYGAASGSARGFVQHHSQQLSRAAVCGDAQNINNAARNMRVAHSLSVPPPARGPSRPSGSLPPFPGLQGSHLNRSQTSAHQVFSSLRKSILLAPPTCGGVLLACCCCRLHHVR